MRKRLIVHIGTPKTATSSIQDYLYKNREALLSGYRVLYPISRVDDSNRIANGTFLLPAYFDENSACKRINGWLNASDCVVLSEELLFNADGLSRLSYLKNINAEVVIVGYLRNAADYLASLWAEFNKFENKVIVSTVENFLNSDAYLSSLGNLRALMHNNNEFSFIVRPYKQRSASGDNLTDFLDLLGIKIDCDYINGDMSNTSITRREADIRQICLQQKWEFSTALNREIIAWVASKLGSGDARPVVNTLSDDVIKAVCDKHENSLTSLMRQFDVADTSFKGNYPSCYGNKRKVYEPIEHTDYKLLRCLLMSV